MWISDSWQDFEVLDCSRGEKLERWGKYTLVRPDPQAIWDTPRTDPRWRTADGRYSRSHTGGGSWDKRTLPQSWDIRYRELTFRVKPMNFKHTGIFPEQAANWDYAMAKIRAAGRPISVLNLFGYTGAATVACAAAGASVCHVDAAKGMVAWGKENAAASGVADRPIRWIVDDCAKFVEREIRRGRRYDAIIMDPPSYGRGPGGEVWKLETNLWPFVELVSGVLSDDRCSRISQRVSSPGASAAAANRRSWACRSRRPVSRCRAGRPAAGSAERKGTPWNRSYEPNI